MSALADVHSADKLGELLMPLVIEYRKWIDAKSATVGSLSPDLHAVARGHLEECTLALARIQRGIEDLINDHDAFLAFRFANSAMLLQRSHTVWARQRTQNPATAPATPRLEGRWRPFQLAFILLNLTGLIHPESDDRQIGDLLWFPTGGGKTEAYLGLAAFTMALRRRRSHPDADGNRTGGGVGVLSRYTLRLLTIQQFRRALGVVTACEFLRVDGLQAVG